MLFLILGLLLLTVTFAPVPAWAVEYTSLISSTDFDGLQTDLLTTASGVISLVLIVAALGLLYKILT